MAFGIDDAMNAAPAGLSLSNVLVETVKAHRKKNADNSGVCFMHASHRKEAQCETHVTYVEPMKI